MVFVIHQHELATSTHVPPHPKPSPHLPPDPNPLGCPRSLALGALLYALNLHWSSILHMVIVYVSMVFSQIFPPSPFPAESKSLFFKITNNLSHKCLSSQLCFALLSLFWLLSKDFCRIDKSRHFILFLYWRLENFCDLTRIILLVIRIYLILVKIGKGVCQAVCCHLAYLIYMQSTSCKMPG